MAACPAAAEAGLRLGSKKIILKLCTSASDKMQQGLHVAINSQHLTSVASDVASKPTEHRLGCLVLLHV